MGGRTGPRTPEGRERALANLLPFRNGRVQSGAFAAVPAEAIAAKRAEIEAIPPERGGPVQAAEEQDFPAGAGGGVIRGRGATRGAARSGGGRAFFGQDYADLGLVFCRPNGRPLDRRALARALKMIAKTAKPRAIRLHDLRHGNASYMASAGVPVRVAAERLGHSDPRLTLRVYQHVLGGQQAEAARAVEEAILGRSI